MSSKPEHGWPGWFVLASVVGVGALVVRYLLTSGSSEPAAPDPNAPSPDAPGGDMIGNLARTGDLVEARDARGVLGLGPDEIGTFRVTSGAPGAAFVTAAVEDARLLNPSAVGTFALARSDIRRILSSGGSAPAPSAPSASAAAPRELSWPLSLQTSKRYLAHVELTGFQASLASPARVATGFLDLGFRGVSASQARPEGWPSSDGGAPTKGTWYVTGTWGGAPENVDRSDATSAITRAWEA